MPDNAVYFCSQEGEDCGEATGMMNSIMRAVSHRTNITIRHNFQPDGDWGLTPKSGEEWLLNTRYLPGNALVTNIIIHNDFSAKLQQIGMVFVLQIAYIAATIDLKLTKIASFLQQQSIWN